MKKIILIAGLLLAVSKILAQTDEEIKNIQSSTNVNALKSLSISLEEKYRINRQTALNYAKIYGWEVIKYKPDGGVAVLQGVTGDNKPIYYETLNNGAGVTIRADKLYTGGGLGLNIHGESMTAAVWDASGILLTHQAFENRALQADNASIWLNHSTHVAGTVIASDQFVGGAARGMAFKGNLQAYDWSNDLGEMATAAGNGLLLSNHSYVMGNYYSAYDYTSTYLDQIMFNAPYYMSIIACGNGGNRPDTLNGGSVAKNAIAVANVNQVTNYTGPASVVISPTSSYGPADDGRIKPDICSKGEAVYSTNYNANNSTYNYGWGTSMAAPGITGTLLLLQQYYNSLNGHFCKAATLKGLTLHTADEAGPNPGPDIIYGWGLMNAEKAAQVIMNANTSSLIYENTLNNGSIYSKTVTASGSGPLTVTICWTDVPGVATADDDLTARLINDLDVRVTNVNTGTVYYPWKLDLNNFTGPAIQGDNNRDNVEKIEIPNAVPGQTYTIVITHKGNLDIPTGGGIQNYSLIISGITVPPCLSDVTITGAYSTPLTESGTWIKSADQTTVSETASVVLDAHNVNGYIELAPVSSADYFLSSPSTGVFIAQPLDGCDGLVPNRNRQMKSDTRPVVYYKLPIILGSAEGETAALRFLPNPATDNFIINSTSDITRSAVKVLNSTGQFQNINVINIDRHNKKVKMNNAVPGIYLIQLITSSVVETGKILIQ